MDYSFNADVATRYGVQEAVFLHNIYWWIAKNEANGRHYYDGRTWTYNSMAAFAKLFPFFTEKQIRRIIQKLSDDGALLIGNYNEDRRDRTQWYALTDEVLSYYIVPKRVDCKRPNGQMQPTQTGKCIYSTDNKQADDKNNIHNAHAREDFVPFGTISKVISQACPTAWSRTQARIDLGETALAGKIEQAVADAGLDEAQLTALFAHADKTYISRTKYNQCDALWVIHNHRKVMATEEDEPPTTAPKQAEKQKSGYTPDYSEYNARFKV